MLKNLIHSLKIVNIDFKLHDNFTKCSFTWELINYAYDHLWSA